MPLIIRYFKLERRSFIIIPAVNQVKETIEQLIMTSPQH